MTESGPENSKKERHHSPFSFGIFLSADLKSARAISSGVAGIGLTIFLTGRPSACFFSPQIAPSQSPSPCNPEVVMRKLNLDIYFRKGKMNLNDYMPIFLHYIETHRKNTQLKCTRW